MRKSYLCVAFAGWSVVRVDPLIRGIKYSLSEEQLEDDEYVADFEARFPLAVDEETILNAISDYVGLAQELTDLLEKIESTDAG